MIPLAALLPIARSAAPALVAVGLAWSAAWYVQGVRLQAAKNELAAERNTSTLALAAAKERANANYDQTAAAWAAAVDTLRRRRADGWLPVLPAASPGRALPAAGGTDGPGADTVPAAAGTEAPAGAGGASALMIDCQTTTLMLNELQQAVERQ